MTLGRRPFLGGLAACAAGPLFSDGAAFSAFDRVPLGKTGVVTSRLVFGTGTNAIDRSCELVRRQGEDGAARLVRHAYDLGIRGFDTADSYGTHAVIAKALRGVPRDSYALVTKYWWRAGGIPERDRAAATPSVERFLRELGTDYLDVVELHCVDATDWTASLAGPMRELEALKKAGKIRAHGCSFHSYAALKAGASSPWLDVAHVRLNPFGRNMTSHPDRVSELVRALRRNGTGVIAMKVLGVGSLAKKPGGIDRSLAWNLTAGGAHALSIGFTARHEIDDIVRRIAAVRRPAPTPA